MDGHFPSFSKGGEMPRPNDFDDETQRLDPLEMKLSWLAPSPTASLGWFPYVALSKHGRYIFIYIFILYIYI